MVKKSSFLEKLKNRWRPASGIRMEPGSDGSGGRLQAVATADREVESVSSRRLTTKQEAVVAINEGFKELASLLRGMQTRIDDQGEQIGSAVDNLGQLPTIGQAQVDLLRGMVERLERQNHATDTLAAKLGDMPEMVTTLRESLDRVVATDERTARTIDEFKTNMAGIQDAMASIVDHSGSIANGQRDLQEQHTEAVRSALTQLQEATDTSVQGLRRAHTEQSQRLGEFVDRSSRSSMAVIGLMSATLIALIVIAVLLATG